MADNNTTMPPNQVGTSAISSGDSEARGVKRKAEDDGQQSRRNNNPKWSKGGRADYHKDRANKGARKGKGKDLGRGEYL